MTDRGREADSGNKKPRSRSRSRIRRVKNGEEKPIGSRLRKLFTGRSHKGSKSVGASASVASDSVAPAVSAEPVVAPIKPKEEATVETPVTEKPEGESEIPSLQLVLLLLDPSTRRFELLQLEFDSMRARVVDIIAQIPMSVTEEAIKKQQYEGVISETSKLMDPTIRLVDFCKEKQVLVALPAGLAVKECVRLARPILSDAQVLKMLNNGGFDVSHWKKKEAPTPAATDDNKTEVSTSRDLPASAQSVEPVKEMKSSYNAFPVIAALAVLAIILQATHNFVSCPIQRGVTLPPGAVRSKCGLVGYLPGKIFPGCSYLEVNHDGTVSVFGEDRELDMLLVGDVCSTEDCVDGLLMEADGSVFIGGKRVKTILVYGNDATLTPWPFEETPKLKVKQFNLNK